MIFPFSIREFSSLLFFYRGWECAMMIKETEKKSGLAWLNGFFWRGIKDFSYHSI